MSDPFKVVVSNEPCEHCGRGKMWSVEGPDGYLCGTEWADVEDGEAAAYEHAEALNHAFAMGLSNDEVQAVK